MDKQEARGNDSGREGSKKRGAVSTGGERQSKAARTGALSDTRHLEDILVPRRQGSEHEGVRVEHLV